MTPHKCPTCAGSGLASRPPWVDAAQLTWADTSAGPYQCKACTGTGILWSPPPLPGLSDAPTPVPVEGELFGSNPTLTWLKKAKQREKEPGDRGKIQQPPWF